ncbi:MAG: STAS domain-containing protein [Roseiflexaceae bacterium]|nr:STAS domain-containing protein [Roseiflexaceae bacterium]
MASQSLTPGWRSRWYNLTHRPIADRLEQRLYPLLFYTAVALGVIDLIGLVGTLLLQALVWGIGQTLFSMIIALSLVALVLAHNGRFRAAAVTIVLGLLSIQMLGLLSGGLTQSSIMLPAMMTSFVFAGLMLRWRLATLISISAIVTVVVIALFVPPLLVPVAVGVTRMAEIGNAFVFACVSAFVLTIVVAFRRALEGELNETLAREHDVRDARDTLQQQVEARTSELRAALAESTDRATQITATLAALEQSEATVQLLHVPLIPVMDGVLLAPLIGVIGQKRAAATAHRILDTLSATHSHTLILDLTSVTVLGVDETDTIMHVASAARLMGSRVVLVGVGPEVAQHMASVDLRLGLSTYATLAQATKRILQSAGRNQVANVPTTPRSGQDSAAPADRTRA